MNTIYVEHWNEPIPDSFNYIIRCCTVESGALVNEGISSYSHGDDLYSVCCIPGHAYGLHLGDIVFAPENVVVAVVSRSGYSTLRYHIQPRVRRVKTRQLMDQIADTGCLLEQITDKLHSIAVKTEGRLAVEGIFKSAEAVGLIEYEDGDAFEFHDFSGSRKDGEMFSDEARQLPPASVSRLRTIVPLQFQ